ncbi:MAG: UbiA family prenyltransferase [Methanobacterium sp.]|uniref:UbiA family prenyltransferase n=1 Tax=Methanobacterium sp. TaxID=2164 RepID=UPI003D654DE6|nr:UbiA family prenyltransferase [Methanobacterium sp.]
MTLSLVNGNILDNHISKNNILYKYVSNLKKEVIYGGYLTAIGAPSLILTVSIIMNVKISLPILLIAYLIPLIIYSFDYYKDLNKDMITNLERSSYLKKKSKVYPYILGFYVIILSVLLIKYTNLLLIIFILIIAFGGILYSTTFKKITKTIPIFKNIYTVLSWALFVTLLIPLYYSLNINISYFLIFLFIFLKGMVNVVFFDLKDIKADKKERLKTLPVMLGKSNVINLLYIINFIAFFPLIIGVCIQKISFLSTLLIIFYFYGFYYINKAKFANNKTIRTKLTSLVDIEYILWPLLLFIFNLLI